MSETYWYRCIDAVLQYPEPRDGGPMRTIRLAHEEPLSGDFSEHLSRVAEMFERGGVDDDQGEGATITFRVSWRAA